MEQRAYSYEELGGLKGQIVEVCEQVAQENPTAWRQAHNGNFDETSTRYNDLCVQALRARGIFAGCNGKRGGEQRSDDILAFGLTDTRGARDASGRFTSMAIIDYIGGAGGPNPSVGWNDVSAASPGRFLDPQGLPSVDGGGTPAPQPGPAPTPQPGPEPPQPPPPRPVDTSVIDEIHRLTAKVDRLTEAITSDVVSRVSAELHGLIGGTLIDVHVDDIVKRLDRIEAGAGSGGAMQCRFTTRWRGSVVSPDNDPELAGRE